MFTDKAEIEIRAGKGGDGKMGFRHEKYRAKGGADGGDGGRGGSIIFESSHNQNTLSKYRNNRTIMAEEGQPGGGNRKAGKSGADVVVPVPVGTVIYESIIPNEPAVLADLTQDGQRAVVAKGGRGGFGNAHFVSSVRQTPRLAEKGEHGERRKITLELKLVADVGLVGLPNAGKSTLLSVISNAKPEIADYPFTTLVPNLGVVDFEQNTFLVADIPGLIEGASEGKGLGDDFLRHIERTAVVLHLVAVDSANIAADYRTIMNELKSYKVDLTDRPQLVVLTKIETVTAQQLKVQTKKLQVAIKSCHAEEKAKRSRSVSLKPGQSRDLDPLSEAADDTRIDLKNGLSIGDDSKIFPISAVAHQGLDVLLRPTSQLVLTARQLRVEEEESKPKAIINQTDFPDLWKIEPEPDGAWRVIGGNIEGHARRSDWDNPDAVERMRDILSKIGVAKELTKRGAQSGDIIRIGTNELEWL